MNQVNVEVNKVLSYYGFPDIKYINVSLIAVQNVSQHGVYCADLLHSVEVLDMQLA